MPSQRAMIWLLSVSACGGVVTAVGAVRWRRNSLRWMPVSRLSRLSVCARRPRSRSLRATSTNRSRSRSASTGNVMPRSIASRTSGRSSRARLGRRSGAAGADGGETTWIRYHTHVGVIPTNRRRAGSMLDIRLAGGLGPRGKHSHTRSANVLFERQKDAPMQLLVVEDNPSIRELLLELLDSAGYAASGAASIAEGLALLGRCAFDLLILDLELPDGDGRRVLRQLRRAGSALPVIVCSGEAQMPACARPVRRRRRCLPRQAVLVGRVAGPHPRPAAPRAGAPGRRPRHRRAGLRRAGVRRVRRDALPAIAGRASQNSAAQSASAC